MKERRFPVDPNKLLVDRSYHELPDGDEIPHSCNIGFDLPIVAEREDGSLYVLGGIQRVNYYKEHGLKRIVVRAIKSKGIDHEARIHAKSSWEMTRISDDELKGRVSG